MYEVRIGGSPKEMGRARARKLRSSILLGMEHWLLEHRDRWGEKERRKWGRRSAKDMESMAPELLDEIAAMAEELGVEEEDLLAFNFRAWNALSPHPSHMSCYNVAFRDPRRGILLGGVVEDNVPFYVLECVRPRKGYAFCSVNWAGMVWAIRGMNSRGLAVGQVSAFPGQPLRRDLEVPFGTDDYARAYFALRSALQYSATVREAIEVMNSFPCTSNFMFADSRGDFAVLEKVKNHYSILRSSRRDGLLIGGGHFSDEGLLRTLIGEGFYPATAEASVARARWVEEFVIKNSSRLSLDVMKEMLTSHSPHGNFCNDFSQAATIGVPEKKEFWVAGYRACRAGFRRYLPGKL